MSVFAEIVRTWRFFRQVRKSERVKPACHECMLYQATHIVTDQALMDNYHKEHAEAE